MNLRCRAHHEIQPGSKAWRRRWRVSGDARQAGTILQSGCGAPIWAHQEITPEPHISSALITAGVRRSLKEQELVLCAREAAMGFEKGWGGGGGGARGERSGAQAPSGLAAVDLVSSQAAGPPPELPCALQARNKRIPSRAPLQSVEYQIPTGDNPSATSSMIKQDAAAAAWLVLGRHHPWRRIRGCRCCGMPSTHILQGRNSLV